MPGMPKISGSLQAARMRGAGAHAAGSRPGPTANVGRGIQLELTAESVKLQCQPNRAGPDLEAEVGAVKLKPLRAAAARPGPDWQPGLPVPGPGLHPTP